MHTVKYHKKEEMIYSRNRINLFKHKVPKKSEKFNNLKVNPKKKVIFKVIIVFLIEIFIAVNIINQISPAINIDCINKAKGIANIIISKQCSIVMKDYKYEDIVNIIKDKDDKIRLIKFNIVPINEITSEVSYNVQSELNNLDESYLVTRLGNFSKIKILSNKGPKVRIRISTMGNVETELKSEIKSTGINQTLHQIYLNVKCEISIITPYTSATESINNQVLIAQSIIVGEVPNSYYNFNNVDDDAALNLIE